ncbi:MAG: hypothetical protein Q7S36_03030 [Candidatus Liptonbacteria bacterium]|nr:hypothetical protein [Candidatus Liptonbacteria bacterium]
MGLPKFWTEEDVKDAVRAADNASYLFLGAIALRILNRMRSERPAAIIAIVCGPITDGGTLGKREVMENLSRFDKKIQRLEEWGFLVFNQLPFEKYMSKIRRKRPAEDPNILLEGFYRLLFESGIINIAYFLPNSQKSSHGARWEKKLAKSLKMPCIENCV